MHNTQSVDAVFCVHGNTLSGSIPLSFMNIFSYTVLSAKLTFVL